MRKHSDYLKTALCLLALFILIFDCKTVIQAVQDGIELCLNTVIPSLFPAMIITENLVNSAGKMSFPALSSIFKYLRLPSGSESIFLAGLLGGYPTGARLVGISFLNGKLSKKGAENILHFCNNAGPAFIFGIFGVLLDNSLLPLALWLIHVASALLVAVCLCKQESFISAIPDSKNTAIPQVMLNCVKSMGLICGWIILFRVLINFFQKWFLWLFPNEMSSLFCGIWELTNGCISLNTISSTGLRFIISSCLLALGGICVLMQTASLIDEISIMPYIKGKLLQSFFSIVLSIMFLIASNYLNSYLLGMITNAVIIIIIILFMNALKKYIAFPKNVIYNTKKVITR